MGSEAVCYAALVKKSPGMTKSNQPYMKCVFRDKRTTVEAPLWSDSRFLNDAQSWVEGMAYRLQVRSRFDLRYGMQIDILGIRAATDDDARDGFDFSDLYESSKYPAEDRLKRLKDLIESLHRSAGIAAARGEHPGRDTRRCSRRCRRPRGFTIVIPAD